MIVKAAGTNTRLRKVEASSPPISAIAIGERNAPPSPIPNAEGTMPAVMAAVVMITD
jgi:hypothetical protein